MAVHSIMGQGAASEGAKPPRAGIVTLEEQDVLEHNQLPNCTPIVRALDGKIVTSFHSAYAPDPLPSTVLGNVYDGDGLFRPILRWARDQAQVPAWNLYVGLGEFLQQVDAAVKTREDTSSDTSS